MGGVVYFFSRAVPLPLLLAPNVAAVPDPPLFPPLVRCPDCCCCCGWVCAECPCPCVCGGGCDCCGGGCLPSLGSATVSVMMLAEAGAEDEAAMVVVPGGVAADGVAADGTPEGDIVIDPLDPARLPDVINGGEFSVASFRL